MGTREFLNTDKGFAEIINSESNAIKKRLDTIVQCEEAQKKGVQLFGRDNLSVILLSRQVIVKNSIKLIFAKYSVGSDFSDIENIYRIALSEKSKVWEKKTIDSFSWNGSDPFYSTDEYWELLQIISLGILLNADENEIRKIIAIRDKVATPDILLDYLCSYFDSRMYAYEQTIGDHYDGLVETIKECNSSNAPKLMKTYLSKQWFKDYKRQGCMATHTSKGNIHSGYWSFESGAIMKILKADDSILKGQQFYPYDMVHWQ